MIQQRANMRLITPMHVFTKQLDDEIDHVPWLANEIPSYRTSVAVQNGVEKNLLLRTWGGLGDQICAEPTMRWAFNNFKGCDISLYSEKPELFKHLPFKKVYDASKKEKPIFKDYFQFNTVVGPESLTWEFFGHMNVNCVDFPSMCAFRLQLPNAEKEVWLKPTEKDFEKTYAYQGGIVIHPGKHWPSKTFPKEWWDAVINGLVKRNETPIIIGADSDKNRSTVDVNTDGCIDLRNGLSIMESIALLQRSHVLLTNDSSPLHMAASGEAHIGYVATCKHPDYITHWRKGEFGWRMTNHGKGGIWETVDYCPNKKDNVTLEDVEQKVLESWLPHPDEFARWAVSQYG